MIETPEMRSSGKTAELLVHPTEEVESAIRRPLGYHPELDGLRAISCLMVLFHHAHVVPGWPAAQVWASWFHGWIGVDVFFVLSGFLITTILIEEERKTGKIDLKSFFIRREFRIVPAYYVAICLYGLFTLTRLGQPFESEFHSHVFRWLLYLGGNGVTTTTGLMDFAWSLRIEQRFYLFWPILFFFITKKTRFRLMLFALCFLLCFSWSGSEVAIDRMRSYYGLLEGCFVALLYRNVIRAPRVDELFKKIPTSLTLLPVTIAFACLFFSEHSILLFSLSVACLLFSLISRDSFTKRVLAYSPLTWLGQRSYSFYLLHMLVLRTLLYVYQPRLFWDSLLLILVAAIVTAAGSAIMFIAVEEPMRKLGKRLSRPSARKTNLEVNPT